MKKYKPKYQVETIQTRPETYWAIHYRHGGVEHSLSMGKEGAAIDSARLILGGADIIVVTKCRTK